MDKRGVTNAILTGIGLPSLLIVVANGVLKLMGFAEFVQGIPGLFDIHGVSIHWNTIFVFMFGLCGAGLLFNNIDWWQARQKRQAQIKARYFNTTGEQAVQYIAHLSNFGSTCRDEEKYELACRSLLEHIRNGQIEARLRREGGAVLEKADRQKLKNVKILPLMQPDSTFGERLGKVVICETFNKTVVFEGIFLDEREMHKIWTPARTRGF